MERPTLHVKIELRLYRRQQERDKLQVKNERWLRRRQQERDELQGKIELRLCRRQQERDKLQVKIKGRICRRQQEWDKQSRGSLLRVAPPNPDLFSPPHTSTEGSTYEDEEPFKPQSVTSSLDFLKGPRTGEISGQFFPKDIRVVPCPPGPDTRNGCWSAAAG